MAKKTERYRVKERKIGGKRWRYCYGSIGTKAEAQSFAKAMRKQFSDRFVYRVVKYSG